MSKLFSAFNTVSKEDWKKKIIFDLNGADYYEELVSNSEGIGISPIYHSDNKIPTHSVLFPENWDIIAKNVSGNLSPKEIQSKYLKLHDLILEVSLLFFF